MAGYDTEQEVARRSEGLQLTLTRARQQVGQLTEQVRQLEYDLRDQARRDRTAHHCPTGEQVSVALRARDSAFQALLEVKQRHEPRDNKYCRCGRKSLECEDQKLVAHYPALRDWQATHPTTSTLKSH